MSKPPMFCTTCGALAPPKIHTPGSFGVEVLAWLLFIFPGVLYSLWRMSARKKVCGSCGALTLIPPTSPIALRMMVDADQRGG